MDGSNGGARHAQGASGSQRPIGEIFVELGFVSRAELETALETQRTTGAQIGEVLVDQGSLSRIDLASALAEHWEPQRYPEEEEETLDESLHGALRLVTEQAALPADPAAPEPGPSVAELERVRVADALAIGVRLATVEAALGDRAAFEEQLRAEHDDGPAKAQANALTDEIQALGIRLDRIERRLDESTGSDPRIETQLEETAALHVELESLAGRVDEILGLRHADAQVARAATERLSARIDAAAATQVDGEVVRRLESEIAELTRQLERRHAIDGSSADLERAVLEALSDLGKRLAKQASTKSKRGKHDKRLRRSIDSLTVAIAAVEARLAKFDRG